jgi:RNA polymerase sigma-70 factor (ECF subfamily)
MIAVMRREAPKQAGHEELDRATLERCQAGDPMAFRAFVVRYERPVFALISRIAGRGPHVEDLAQDTFLRAFRALPDFDLDGPARPSTWLLTIATRLALDARRKKTPALLAVLPEAVNTTTPEHESSRAELQKALLRAIEALPDDQRAAFVLAEFHGFGGKEIAEALGVAENTVKTRLFRAREKLGRALDAYKGDS